MHRSPLAPPAIQWCDGSPADDVVVENWQRADRACSALRAAVLHDAWLSGYTPSQLASLLDLSSSYVGRLVSHGCVVATLLEADHPWDTMPTERSTRAYMAEQRQLTASLNNVEPQALIHERELMHVAAADAVTAMHDATPAASLPASGEEVIEPAKHPTVEAAEALRAGRRGVQTLGRWCRTIDATLARYGALSAFLEQCPTDEAEKAVWYIRKVHRLAGDMLDELS
jgi:hypothetical protein